MSASIRIFANTFFATVLLLVALPALADLDKMSGTWSHDASESEELSDQIKQLKQEFHEWQSEYGGINDPDKPDPFESRKFGTDEWETRRSGPVPNASVDARQIVEAESLKLYVSERIIVSYDGKLTRRVSPNPAGRVYSATGKGVSSDSVGQTLAYLDEDSFVIETRMKSAEQLVERFELTSDDVLKVTINLKNPDWRREVSFVRYFKRVQ